MHEYTPNTVALVFTFLVYVIGTGLALRTQRKMNGYFLVKEKILPKITDYVSLWLFTLIALHSSSTYEDELGGLLWILFFFAFGLSPLITIAARNHQLFYRGDEMVETRLIGNKPLRIKFKDIVSVTVYEGTNNSECIVIDKYNRKARLIEGGRWHRSRLWAHLTQYT